MAVQFGVFVPQGWRMELAEIRDPIEQYEAMTRAAQAADALPAFDSIWLYDHFHTIPQPTQASVFECWTTTAALARDTTRIHVGQMVTCLGYRNPALLAKMASTVDVLSHGRLYCGIGAGWYEHEWRAYGYGFPETRDRMRAFREACEILNRMWTDEVATYSGEYASVAGAINQPKGVRKPHPALWIGGSGEQVTLKLVARWADACNVGGNAETLRHKLAVLKRHCDDLGRPYEQITRSNSINALLLKPGESAEAASAPMRALSGESFEEYSRLFTIGTPEQIVEEIQSRVDAGINYVIAYLPRLAHDHEQMYRFAEEVIPYIR